MTDKCEMPDYVPPSARIREILKKYKRIAIVGLSHKPHRDSFKVAEYLLDHGYDIIPVNPNRTEILGKKSYPDLASIPKPPEIVDIFRRPDAIPAIVDEAINAGAKVIWMQLGLANREAAQKARNAGLEVVQSRCIKIEHEAMEKNFRG